MVVIGVDAHKRTHTLAVGDEVGRALGNRTFPATLDGHRAAFAGRGRDRRACSPWRTAVISPVGSRPTSSERVNVWYGSLSV